MDEETERMDSLFLSSLTLVSMCWEKEIPCTYVRTISLRSILHCITLLYLYYNTLSVAVAVCTLMCIRFVVFVSM